MDARNSFKQLRGANLYDKFACAFFPYQLLLTLTTDPPLL